MRSNSSACHSSLGGDKPAAFRPSLVRTGDSSSCPFFFFFSPNTRLCFFSRAARACRSLWASRSRADISFPRLPYLVGDLRLDDFSVGEALESESESDEEEEDGSSEDEPSPSPAR